MEREYRGALAEEVEPLSHYRFWGFDVGSAELRGQFFQRLQEIADLMRNDPSVQRLTISGHTSHTGPEELNEQLSLDRAEAARALLIEMGVEPERIAVTPPQSYREPLVEERNDAARARNRRIEIRLERHESGRIPEEDQAPGEYRVPCEFCRWHIRFNEALQMAWAAWMAGEPGRPQHRGVQEGFVDPGISGVELEKPNYTHHWITAMQRYGFSREEARRYYDWYPGEPLPNGPYEAPLKAGEEITRLEAILRSGQCDPNPRYDGPLADADRAERENRQRENRQRRSPGSRRFRE